MKAILLFLFEIVAFSFWGMRGLLIFMLIAAIMLEFNV